MCEVFHLQFNINIRPRPYYLCNNVEIWLPNHSNISDFYVTTNFGKSFVNIMYCICMYLRLKKREEEEEVKM